MKFLIALLALAVPAFAQTKKATPTGEAPGPWILGTIGVGKNADGTVKTTALKGLAIKVGDKGEAAVCYDLDLCRMTGAWTGKFTTPMNLMSRGEYPVAMGEVAFTTGEIAGFTTGDAAAWKDARAEPFGPLPTGQARFKGFHTCGDATVIVWDFAGTEILELPGYLGAPDLDRFTRAFSVGPSKAPILIPLCRAEAPAGKSIGTFPAPEPRGPVREIAGICYLELPPHNERWFTDVEILVSPNAGTIKQTVHSLGMSHITPDPKGWLDHQRARWPETVTTTGELSAKKDDAYVVDTIKLPDPNPWNAPMFVGGFDFFPDGRAAVCTFHGDVFIVSGIDEKLEKVTWRRFASGLYHALGLKVVNGEIYVTCRDGLWRLRDLNGDGEADSYELFNGDLKATKNFHEFVFDLQTDPQGNFYFAKAGPVKNGGRGFEEIMAHHGAMMRVSPDGAKLDVVATGFRAPNGIGCGPHGELTSGDNEGTWTPACKINWIRPGGFYGVVPLAHRAQTPTDYDRPLCWMPKRTDNSGGAQIWVTSEKWGPWGNQLLHLSYGTCSVFGVLKEQVSGANIPSSKSEIRIEDRAGAEAGGSNQKSEIVQGGVVRFPLNFQSGIMRARFNPADDQLYVAGLRGWQTTGVKNGCLQRVRYTGAPVRMPVAMHAKKGALAITFSSDLDPASVADAQDWNLEQWNYLWSASYGSPEVSTEAPFESGGEVGRDGAPQWTKAQMGKPKHDTVTVASARLLDDKRTVVLAIPALKPVMQMSVKYSIKAADGAPVTGEIIHTIHALGE